MLKSQWMYTISAQDIADLWSFIQFTPENGFNPAWKVEDHTSLQRSENSKDMFIRHISVAVFDYSLSPKTPYAATWLCLALMPESIPTIGELPEIMPILSGTQGATNILYANFPRSLYMNKGLVVYVATAGFANPNAKLVVNCLWEAGETSLSRK